LATYTFDGKKNLAGEFFDSPAALYRKHHL